jgi:hypothetical protein
MEATDDSIEWEEFQASMETLVSRLKCQRFTKRPVAGAVLFRGPCAFASLIVSTFGPAKWIQIFDSDREVEDGAVPKIPSLPMSEKGFVTMAGPILMTRGLYVCGSGTHQQKKKAETDLSMFVQILSASKDGNKL